MSAFNAKPRRVPEFDSESERGEFYRNKALSYLELRMRTEAEVRQYLKDWQCPEPLIEETVLFLLDYHYLDDQAFAEAYVRQERELNHRSRRDIQNRLAQRGIDKETAAQAFTQEEETEAAEVEQARILLEKRLKAGKTDREKTLGFLQRRGFSYQTIRRAMEEMEWEVPDEGYF